MIQLVVPIETYGVGLHVCGYETQEKVCVVAAECSDRIGLDLGTQIKCIAIRQS